MKKYALIFMVLAGVLSIPAKPQPLPENEGMGYAYLTFEMTDGTKASIATSSLTLTISGNTLTAGSQSFSLSNLSKMYFSNTDETTGIEEMPISTIDEATEIYDLQGHQIPREQMRKGVYIIKTKNRISKIVVK